MTIDQLRAGRARRRAVRRHAHHPCSGAPARGLRSRATGAADRRDHRQRGDRGPARGGRSGCGAHGGDAQRVALEPDGHEPRQSFLAHAGRDTVAPAARAFVQASRPRLRARAGGEARSDPAEPISLAYSDERVEAITGKGESTHATAAWPLVDLEPPRFRRARRTNGARIGDRLSGSFGASVRRVCAAQRRSRLVRGRKGPPARDRSACVRCIDGAAPHEWRNWQTQRT